MNIFLYLQKFSIILFFAFVILISFNIPLKINNTPENMNNVTTEEKVSNNAHIHEGGNLGEDIPMALVDRRIIWGTGFEKNDPRLWLVEGGFIYQGNGSYFLTTPIAHDGKFSIVLSIDTRDASVTGSHAAYLFVPFKLMEKAYYYSAWYYVPGRIRSGYWWNIWQWKSTYNGSTRDSKPLFVIGILRKNETNYLYLRDIENPERNGDLLQEEMPAPVDRWFQIEAYYMKDNNNSGKVIVWQDGVEMFNLTDVNTTLSDNTVLWSVNNYTDTIAPNPCTIYIDDIAISRERLGPG